MKIYYLQDELKSIWEGLDFHCDNEVNYTEFLAATISSIVFILLIFFHINSLYLLFIYLIKN